MKLSEAIRLGSMLQPQGFVEFHSYDGSTCALGAAGDAIGRTFSDSHFEVYEVWPFLDSPQRCPACPSQYQSASHCIAHLNDSHKWTREQIADWVATIEPPETPPAIERAPDEDFAWVQTSHAARAD